jgi:hypothetical protein
LSKDPEFACSQALQLFNQSFSKNSSSKESSKRELLEFSGAPGSKKAKSDLTEYLKIFGKKWPPDISKSAKEVGQF